MTTISAPSHCNGARRCQWSHSPPPHIVMEGRIKDHRASEASSLVLRHATFACLSLTGRNWFFINRFLEYLKSLCLTIIPLMPPWHRLLCTTGISASRHWQSQTNTDDVTIRKSLRYVCSSVYRLFYGLCNEDRNPETGQKQSRNSSEKFSNVVG